MIRLALWASIVSVFFIVVPEAKASQTCENVYIGEAPPQIISYDSSRNNAPIYGSPQPLYQLQCVWKYGAVAINPTTRSVFAAWNYDNINAAENYVDRQCGRRCTRISFADDFAYIALSDDDSKSGVSTISSEDAVRQCEMVGGVDCSTVVAASSTASSLYWHFGAIAHNTATGMSGSSWNHLRRSDARQTAMESCGAGCWSYAFQTGNGGLAAAADGNLFGAWSGRNEESAGNAAIEECEKVKGEKNCSVVYTGSATAAPTFKPKVQQSNPQ